MPIFVFNKLVRDKLKEEYEKLGQVAVYKKLTRSELLEAFRQKIIEEAHEIPIGGSRSDSIAEISDVQQVLDDMKKHLSISSEEIAKSQHEKFEKRGGFSKGLYVETLELQDGDEWVLYFRKHPDVFKEIK